MPHAVIDYSENMHADVQSCGVTRLVHDALTQSGLFQPQDIKTRAHSVRDFWVGAKGQEGRFIHVILYLLEGRTMDKKQSLSQAVLDKLVAVLKNVDSITVDVRELVKDTYRKASA